MVRNIFFVLTLSLLSGGLVFIVNAQTPPIVVCSSNEEVSPWIKKPRRTQPPESEASPTAMETQRNPAPADVTPLVQAIVTKQWIDETVKKNHGEKEPPAQEKTDQREPQSVAPVVVGEAPPLQQHDLSMTAEDFESMQEFLVQYGSIRTPKDLFRYFFRTCVVKRNYKAAKLCMAFGSKNYLTEASQRDCLYKWSYIIERLQDVDPSEFPQDLTSATYPFTTAKGATLELEFVKDAGGYWQLAPSALLKTNAIFKDVLGDPPIRNRFLMNRVPAWMFQLWGELSYLQWSILGTGFLIGFIVYMIVQWTLYLIVLAYTRVIYKSVTRHSRTVLRQIASIGMVLVWFQIYTMVVRDPGCSTVAFYACVTYVTVMSVLILLKIVDLVAEMIRCRFKAANSRIDDLVVPLFSRTMKGAILCIGAVSLASAFNLPVVGLVSGMGIGGIAIAFAAKETVANLFGSLTVLMDRPFVIGDWIVTGGVEGTVEAVGMRSTRIRTFYNSVVTIPNNNLTTAVIDNMGQRIYRRYKTFLNLQYDTDPDRIVAFCEGVREIVRRNPFTRKDYISVHLFELKSSSIDIVMTIFFICPDSETENRERADILCNILRLAKAMDVRFAYPTQTLHLHAEENVDYAALPGGDPFETGRTAAVRVLTTEDSIRKTA